MSLLLSLERTTGPTGTTLNDMNFVKPHQTRATAALTYWPSISGTPKYTNVRPIYTNLPLSYINYTN